jgi:AcrR family transcriptional regulator
VAQARAAAGRARPPRTDEGDTKRRILDAALEGFSERGFAGTSIRQIARAAGIRESAIYNHFAGKQAIFDALLSEAGPGVAVDLLGSEVRGGDDPATAIRRIVEQAIEAWDQPRARRFTSIALREGGPASALVGVGLARETGRVLKALASVFQGWMDAGLIRADFPAEHIVWELMAPMGIIRIIHLRADASDATRREGRRLADRHLEYFLDCVVKPGAARPGACVVKPGAAGPGSVERGASS